MSGLRAVVTGDIIGSSKLAPPDRRRMPKHLREAHTLVREKNPELLPYSLAIVRGDGWQCYVKEPDKALSCILQFWTLLCAKGLRSRFVLAVDKVDFIADGGLSESGGPAFRRSGRGLDELEDSRWTACRLPVSASDLHRLASKGIFELLDHLLQEWTQAQSQALSKKLRAISTDSSVTQREIARQWEPEPITRQSVNRHLKRAHWNRLERLLNRFEKLVQSL